MPVPRFGDAVSVSVLSGSPTVTLALPPTAESASQARHEIAAAGLDDDIAHTVSLLVSEVVGNAIRHAAHAGMIHVGATLGPGFARVEVLDGGPGFDPEVRHDSDGFGLRLMDKLATRWGVERARGTLVWFEVDRRRRRFDRDQ